MSAALDPKTHAVVRLPGSAVRFDVRVTDPTGAAGLAGLDLEAWTFFDPRTGTTNLVNAGPLRLGTAQYPGELDPPACSTGCRLEGIGVVGVTGQVSAC